jgi:dGTPase
MAESIARYDDAARERWVPEPPKRAGRTAFERDRARVLHSAALRRLSGKTQVVGPGDTESDFPRTRLTHSLECAQVGRELGAALGCDPDLVETACLAHDLGHPPFGHNGETALDAVSSACGGFEGNAQSLRILTRLEAKTLTASGRSAGLNLTRATLDAATKYPWGRRGGERKFGAYADDLEVLTWVRLGAPDDRTPIEAQVMDWADDVAYSVHDLEDGLHAGHIKLEDLMDADERTELTRVAAELYCTATEDELGEALQGLLSLPCWPGSYDGSLQALAGLKNLTSELIGRFTQAAEAATREAYGRGPLTRYGADLVVPQRARLECALLKAITARYVMGRDGAVAMQSRQRDLVGELVEVLLRSSPSCLEPPFGAAFTAAENDSGRLRVVVDQVASLTDASAVAWHRRLGGG